MIKYEEKGVGHVFFACMIFKDDALDKLFMILEFYDSILCGGYDSPLLLQGPLSAWQSQVRSALHGSICMPKQFDNTHEISKKHFETVQDRPL